MTLAVAISGTTISSQECQPLSLIALCWAVFGWGRLSEVKRGRIWMRVLKGLSTSEA